MRHSVWHEETVDAETAAWLLRLSRRSESRPAVRARIEDALRQLAERTGKTTPLPPDMRST